MNNELNDINWSNETSKQIDKIIDLLPVYTPEAVAAIKQSFLNTYRVGFVDGMRQGVEDFKNEFERKISEQT